MPCLRPLLVGGTRRGNIVTEHDRLHCDSPLWRPKAATYVCVDLAWLLPTPGEPKRLPEPHRGLSAAMADGSGDRPSDP
jgi:hypothetical protein